MATVVFADVSGFTALSERMDPEDVKALGANLTSQMGEEVSRFGGTVISIMGDAVMAVFGAPVAHEDDAERAVRCALSMQASVKPPQDVPVPLELHIGINTGEVMAGMVGPEGHREYTAMGDVTNTAARLQSAARAGEILVGRATYEATRNSIEYEEGPAVRFKGKEGPVAVWRAMRARSGPAERPASTAPLVGRDAELELLDRLWSQAIVGSRPYLATVLGPPGIGKSRLLREFEARRPDARVLRGRCVPYGEGTGYDAFGHQVRAAAGILDSDPVREAVRKLTARIGELVPDDAADEVARNLMILLGLSAEGSPDKQLLFASVRSFVEALAREAPTVLVFEDIHWAQPVLLELLEILGGRVREAPLLVIGAARPELLEARPSWGGGLPRYTAIHLESLDDEDARRLAGSLLAGLSADILEGLIDTGGGNPLFLEELVASHAERAAEETSRMPSTVQAIIAARLDALADRERSVLQDASVMGRFFWRGALAALAGEDGLGEALDALELRDFVRRQPASRFAGEPEYTFKHILTSEVAYGTLPHAARRPRHATVAEYLEGVAGDRRQEQASVIAHHWKEAAQPSRAVPYLLMGADAASRTWAKERAIALYGEVVDILGDEGDRAVVEEALLGRAEALLASNDFGPAAEENLSRLLDRSEGRTRALAYQLRALLAYWRGDASGARKYADEAIELARQVADAAIESRALAMLGEVAGMEGDLDAARDLSTRAASGWPRAARDGNYGYTCALLGAVLYWRGEYDDALRWAEAGYSEGVERSNLAATLNSASNAGLALAGLSRHEEALEWLQRAVTLGREWEPEPRLTGRAVNILSGTFREVGDFAAAREISLEGEELGRSATFPGASISARIDLLVLDLLEGDVGAAERAFPDVFAAAEQTKGWHQWLFSGRLADAKARVELLAGRPENAAAAAEEALGMALRYGRTKYACRSRMVLGESLLALGRPEPAADAFGAAHEDAERLRHAPSRWAALAGLAGALERLGSETDAAEAAARARQAIDDFASTLSENHRRTLLASVFASPAARFLER